MAGRSSLDPTSTQTPRATERMPGICSVTMRRPDSYSVRPMSPGALRERWLAGAAGRLDLRAGTVAFERATLALAGLKGRADRPAPGHARGLGPSHDAAGTLDRDRHARRPRAGPSARLGPRPLRPRRGATRLPAGPSPRRPA